MPLFSVTSSAPSPGAAISATSATSSNSARYPVNQHALYHAHVYFDADTVAQARELVAAAGARFGLQVGRVHEKEVGPHPRWSCQLVFSRAQFDAVIAWLDAHRAGLDVFVHGVTGNDLADHTTPAYWLGRAWALKLGMFGG